MRGSPAVKRPRGCYSTTNLTTRHRLAAPASILLEGFGDLSQDAPLSGAPAMGGKGTFGSEGSGGPGVSGHPIEPPTAAVALTLAMTPTNTTIRATNPAKLIALPYCRAMNMACSPCAASPVSAGSPSRNTALVPYGNMTYVSFGDSISVPFNGTSISFTDVAQVSYLNNTHEAYTDSPAITGRDTTSGSIVTPGAAIAAVPMSNITRSFSSCIP